MKKESFVRKKGRKQEVFRKKMKFFQEEKVARADIVWSRTTAAAVAAGHSCMLTVAVLLNRSLPVLGGEP